jgi:phosphonate transport system substrate-binding protein
MLLMQGCDVHSEAAEGGHPKKIIIGMTPSEDAERTYERMQVITRYFREKLGMEVEQLLVNNPAAMIEAMRANKIHVGSGGPFTYLVANQKAGAEALVMPATLDGEPNYYRSCLITSPKLGLNNLDDLKARAKDLTLAWAYPTSCSGHLVPRYYMQEAGIFPDDFKRVLIASNHASSFFTVISGKVDVAAVSYTTYKRYLDTGRFKEADVKVIWLSEPIPPSPVFIRNDLDENLKKRIQQAYVEMPQDTLAWRVLRGQYAFEIEYRPTDDSVYEPLRQMANQIKGLTLDEKSLGEGE